MEFKILGPLLVCHDGIPLDLGSPLQRKVLAVLLVHHNQVVPRRSLITDVWSDDAVAFDPWQLEQRKRAVLHTYIGRLRAALRPAADADGPGAAHQRTVIATEASGYRLLLDDDVLDENRFRTLLEQGRRTLQTGDLEAATDRLSQGLSLWRGQPLGEFGDDQFARETVVRLHSLRVSGIEAKLDADLRLGRHHDLIGDPDLRQWVHDYPDNEGLRSSLALALYRSGQTAAAATVCEEGLAFLRRHKGSVSTMLEALLVDIRSRAAPTDVSLAQRTGPAGEVPRRPATAVPGPGLTPTPPVQTAPSRTLDGRPTPVPAASAHRRPSWLRPTVWVPPAAAALVAVFLPFAGVKYMPALAVLAVVATIAAVARISAGSPEVASTPDQVESAVRALAWMSQRQWRAEVALRQLRDPAPMAVRWQPSGREVSDHRDVVGGSVAGRTDQLDILLEAFRGLRSRRLVVLGPPGSGKSTVAVLLTLRLLEDRRPDEPVAVLLSMSSWHPYREHLHAWLRRRLAEDFPYLGDQNAYGGTAIWDLVVDRRILPVLDGLDELPESLRPAALTSINQAVMEGGPLILTCRTAEYRAAVATGDVVTAAAVIESQPLQPDDVISFLRNATPPGPRLRRWQPVFRRISDRPVRDEPDNPLRQALSNPLMVLLARMIYSIGEADPGELTDPVRFPDRTAIENHLLDALIPTLIGHADRQDTLTGRMSRSWDRTRVAGWLTFLALHAHRLRSYDLAWWQLPQALPVLARARYRAMLMGVLAGLAALPLVGIGAVATRGFELGMLTAVKHGIAYALATWIAGTLAVTSGPGLPHDGKRLALTTLSTGLASGSVFGLLSGLSAAWVGGLWRGVLSGLAYGLTAFVVYGLGAGLAGLLVSTTGPARANFRLSGRVRALVRHLTTGLGLGFAAGVAIGVVEHIALHLAAHHGVRPDPGLVIGLWPGFVLGLGTGFAYGLVRWAKTPMVAEDTVGPQSTLRADRSLFVALTCLLIVAFVVTFAIADSFSRPGSFAAGLGFGLASGVGGGIVLGIVLGFTGASWPLYLLARTWLALRGHLPWRLTAFLADIHRLGILRQVGAVYQFRHASLQDRLVAASEQSRDLS